MQYHLPHASGCRFLVSLPTSSPLLRLLPLLSRYQTLGQPLSHFDDLYRSKNPAIGDVKRWFSGYALTVDADGNCFGTSWMIMVLMWAVQSRIRLRNFIDRLESARFRGGAFSGLDGRPKVGRHT